LSPGVTYHERAGTARTETPPKIRHEVDTVRTDCRASPEAAESLERCVPQLSSPPEVSASSSSGSSRERLEEPTELIEIRAN
jgi:hypothetical protein